MILQRFAVYGPTSCTALSLSFIKFYFVIVTLIFCYFINVILFLLMLLMSFYFCYFRFIKLYYGASIIKGSN